jgi:DNA-nicking Smr family endonuclease
VRRRDLSEEERDLWRQAVRDVKPSKRRRTAPEKAPPKPAQGRKKIATAAPPPASPADRKRHPILGGGDPKLDRAAATRRIAVDRVLDLHGLTQSEAHRILPRFLAQAVDEDAHLVLVITGKGRSATGRGVLRARFLDWIEEAPLRALIARVATAKPKDGGEGAFYVFLKRKSAGAAPRS